MKTQYLEITKLLNGNLQLDLTIDGAGVICKMQEDGCHDDEIVDTVCRELDFYKMDQTTIHSGELFNGEYHKIDEWVVLQNGVSKSFLEEGNTFVYKYQKEASEERKRSLVAKMAAKNWVTFSSEKAIDGAMECNRRHVHLAKAFYMLLGIQELFEYKNYKQDEEYFNKIKDTCDFLQKEMDYCTAKMEMLGKITGGNLQSEDIVKDLHKKYRESIKTTAHETEANT